MKKFEVYRNIRQRAMIFGLPVSLFALMMIAIIASLLVITFSFGFGIIIGALVFNSFLYIGLTKFAQNLKLLQFSKVFPKIISIKKSSELHYEQD
ncbi:hypothetical protein HZY62_15545 [Maribacter polysiphoniae]|uniref:Uncharacterized protein n=1 Tax=Maribacter polysiphoniae TaxID=429344 RepID=A0A316DUT3_9FLAO|nr:hypothetical protein [Maribacter polysiphoniae]MBD1262016.1 hypothetical protein [Maribacter polysiphoniae]PWK21705.1 hypothetical protein LX92_03484 [Maribacter polysiphoniae]